MTHQLRDAFYLATHQAVREGGTIRVVVAPEAKQAEAEFMMIREGLVCFEGSADALRRSTDPYLRAFVA